MEEVHHKGGFPSDFKGSNRRIVKPTAPYLDHLSVRSRSRKEKRRCKVIVVPVRNNEQFAAYIDNYQVKACNNDLLKN
jgi:hypothetical protein